MPSCSELPFPPTDGEPRPRGRGFFPPGLHVPARWHHSRTANVITGGAISALSDGGPSGKPSLPPSASRANKQRDEPALERRNQIGGLAHDLVLLPASGPIQSQARLHWLTALDDTVNVITIAIQFRHIVMAVTFQLAMVRSLKSCCRCRSRGRISANGMVRRTNPYRKMPRYRVIPSGLRALAR
jgi:hypothetical protein